MGAGHKATQLWPCKDGWVSWSHGGSSRLAPSLPLIRWMQAEGMSNKSEDIKLQRFDLTRLMQASLRFGESMLAHRADELS